MPTVKQHVSSKTNWANALWLGLVIMVGSWDIAVVEKWMTPEAVAFGSLAINIGMRMVTKIPLEEK